MNNRPPEICPEHDIVIDAWGCWVCGHAGPLSANVADTFMQWVLNDIREDSHMNNPCPTCERDCGKWCRSCGWCQHLKRKGKTAESNEFYS